MIHALSLESFDHAEASAPEDNSKYQDGYDQGLADARKAYEADQSRLAAELVQSVSDLDFKYVEARADITASLAPLFAAIVEKVLPQCVAQGFVMQITALLDDASAQWAATPLEVSVHPSQKDAVTAALSVRVSDAVVIGDDQLSHHAAWVTHQRGELHIDLDSVARKIETILSTVELSLERNKKNG